MNSKNSQPDRRARFTEVLIGVLLYSVVLGFFNDYTNILNTTSYSTTFLMAVVMQVLTEGTFAAKRWVKDTLSSRTHRGASALLIFGVWLVLFLSKFVFLVVIDVLFGENVSISGFVGLMVIIVVWTIAQKAIEKIYTSLQSTHQD